MWSHGLVVALALVLVACGSSDPAPAPTPPPEPAEVPAPPPRTPEVVADPVVAEAPARPSTPPRPSRETAREAARHVRDGRRAAHAGRFAEALAAFDRAVALVPNQPRVLCESGLVAHRAADEESAARRIDRALRGFGPVEHVGEALREPLAMCLYNRGLVAEALSEADAAEHYERSLALRPNATVRAALERVRGAAADEASEAEGILRLDRLDAVLEALRQRMASTGEDGGAPAAAANVTIRERTTCPREGGREIVVVDVDSGDESYPVQSLAVVTPAEGGFRVGVLEIGAVDLMVSGTEGDVQLLAAETRCEGDVLVLHVTRSTDLGTWDSNDTDAGYCSEQRWHSVSESFDVLCPPTGPCRLVQVEASDSGETVHRECEPTDWSEEAEDEAAGEVTSEDEVVSEPERMEVTVRIEGSDVVITGEGGTDLIEPGRARLDELEALPGPPGE